MSRISVGLWVSIARGFSGMCLLIVPGVSSLGVGWGLGHRVKSPVKGFRR